MDQDDFQTEMLTGLHDMGKELGKEIGKVTTEVAVTNAKLEAQEKHLQGVHVTVSDIRDNGTQACKVNATEINTNKGRLENLEGERRMGNRAKWAYGGGGVLGGGSLLVVLWEFFTSLNGG